MTTRPYRRWPPGATHKQQITVGYLLNGRFMPDRPHAYDALTHVADIDPDTLAAPDVDYDLPAQLARLAAALDTLPERHRVVIEARMDGATLAEAGAAIGRSRERAAQIERQVVCRLREGRFGLCRWVDAEELGPWGGVWKFRRWEAA